MSSKVVVFSSLRASLILKLYSLVSFLERISNSFLRNFRTLFNETEWLPRLNNSKVLDKPRSLYDITTLLNASKSMVEHSIKAWPLV